MRCKPRNTISRSPNLPNSTRLKNSNPTSKVRRRRWIYSKPSLILLLILQPALHLFSFVLLTEPCLNPHFTPNLWSKFNYFSLLFTPGLIPQSEWKERFAKAGIRSLFGCGILQVWYVARLNSYFQKAQREHLKIVALLKDGKKMEEAEVSSFIRQLESVSLTLLGLPFVIAIFYSLCVLVGVPLLMDKIATLIVATQLAFLVGLPLVHILGLPQDSTPTTTTDTKPSNPNPPSPTNSGSNFYSTTSLPSTSKYWTQILSLHPNPSFLLPLYYPPFFVLLGTLISTAVLALDWEVGYQTYPYPLLVGSLVGLVIGNLYTIFVVLFT